MNVAIKKGSMVKIPLPMSATADTSDASIVAASLTAGMLMLTAMTTGQCTLFLKLGTDFRAELIVDVIA
jgi:hypothetical protein